MYCRVHAAGWVSAELVSSETLSAAYNIPCRQPQVGVCVCVYVYGVGWHVAL